MGLRMGLPMACYGGLFQTLGLQIAQSRSYLHTLGPKVGIIYIHGALGKYGVYVWLSN